MISDQTSCFIEAINHCLDIGWLPTRAFSRDGEEDGDPSVALVWSTEMIYADIEFFEDGDIFCVARMRGEEGKAWEVRPDMILDALVTMREMVT